MVRTYSVDLQAEGHHVLGVSLLGGLGSINRSISEARSDSPAYGTHVEIPAVVELLDLIAAGAVTVEEVRNDLLQIGTEINEDQEREAERWQQEVEEPEGRSVRSDSAQQADLRWVYVVSSEDNPKVVKIGVASDVERRIKNLQVAAPTRIVLRWSARGGLPLESHLHEKFRRRRMSGEWFDFRKVSNPVRVIVEAALTFMGDPELTG